MKDLILYHGSRGGIAGDIQPISRIRCDFGKGFYMGNSPDQAKSLVANDSDPYFYRVRLRLSELPEDRILVLQGMDWAFFVLYNRGKLDEIKGSKLYKKYSHIGDGKDVIIGPITDDAMNDTMRKFVAGEITDKAFFESIRVINYGVQYVAKTAAACQLVDILQERALTGGELSEAMALAEERRLQGGIAAEKAQKRFRREGRYLDEIIARERTGMER